MVSIFSHIKHISKEENFINSPNGPTIVSDEIFQILETYENLNLKNMKQNLIASGWNSKYKLKKNINLNPSLLITETGNVSHAKETNNSTKYGTGLLKADNQDSNERNKKIYITNEQKGLDDNYLNDYQNKRKAKLELLLLMHKFSGGKFCKVIKNHFLKPEKTREDHIKGDMSHNKEDEVIKKNYARQKCLESFDTKDLPRTYDKLSDVNSKNNAEFEYGQSKNKLFLSNMKPQYRNKLPKISEEKMISSIFRKSFKMT